MAINPCYIDDVVSLLGQRAMTAKSAVCKISHLLMIALPASDIGVLSPFLVSNHWLCFARFLISLFRLIR